MHIRRLLLPLVMLPFLAAAAAAPAPRMSIASLAQLPVVERVPYDTDADANADLAVAFARARKSGKRVMIDFGGNWCGDCVVLANVVLLPEMKRFMAAHFEFVKVDVGRFDKNTQILDRFGIVDHLKKEGVPAVVVAEPDGTFVNRNNIAALEDASHMTPQAIADWLAQWAK
ncbi:MAG: thioredoxin family protein [Alphaproteobacteria bacterium]|nr:thioredoxin family protein [Alphaproteobacteria bacterium]